MHRGVKREGVKKEVEGGIGVVVYRASVCVRKGIYTSLKTKCNDIP